MGRNNNYRHELKYQCSEAQLTIIQSRLEHILNFDNHTKDGHYSIRSMYFDNYDNRCYYENESGTDPREKFRIRIYNADKSRISLECKRKERGKTYKTSCLISEKEYHSLVSGEGINQISESSELVRKFNLLIKTQLYTPKVIVEYDRIPYVYNIGNVRITLDKNIKSSNSFSSFFTPTVFGRQIMPKGQHILEVKYDELLPDFIKEVLQIDNLQRITFSKYYLCRKHSVGGVV